MSARPEFTYPIGTRVQFNHHGYAAVGTIVDNTHGNLYGGQLSIDYKVSVEKTMCPFYVHREGINTFVWDRDVVGEVVKG